MKHSLQNMSFYLVSKKGQLYKCNVYIKPRNLFTRQPLSRPWSTKGPKAVPKAAPPSSQVGAALSVRGAHTRRLRCPLSGTVRECLSSSGDHRVGVGRPQAKGPLPGTVRVLTAHVPVTFTKINHLDTGKGSVPTGLGPPGLG